MANSSGSSPPSGDAAAARTCSRPECDLAAASVYGDSKRTRAYCTAACRDRHVWSKLAEPRCIICRTRFQQSPGRGRNAIYCGGKCKSRREREITKAIKDLAKDHYSGDLREDLRLAEILYAAWMYDRRHLHAYRIDDLVDRHWHGQPPPRIKPATPKAIAALAERLTELHRRISAADAERRKRERRAADKAADEKIKQLRVTDRAADAEWRRDLIGGADA